MSTRRLFLIGSLLLLAAATALSVAEAKQPCSTTWDQCLDACNQRYAGSTELDGLQREGCRVGCTMAYGWCLIIS